MMLSVTRDARVTFTATLADREPVSLEHTASKDDKVTLAFAHDESVVAAKTSKKAGKTGKAGKATRGKKGDGKPGRDTLPPDDPAPGGKKPKKDLDDTTLPPDL